VPYSLNGYARILNPAQTALLPTLSGARVLQLSGKIVF